MSHVWLELNANPSRGSRFWGFGPGTYSGPLPWKCDCYIVSAGRDLTEFCPVHNAQANAPQAAPQLSSRLEVFSRLYHRRNARLEAHSLQARALVSSTYLTKLRFLVLCRIAGGQLPNRDEQRRHGYRRLRDKACNTELEHLFTLRAFTIILKRCKPPCRCCTVLGQVP